MKYVAISMVDGNLSTVIICDDFDNVVKAALRIIKSWPKAVRPECLLLAKQCIEDTHQVHFINMFNRIPYTVHVGVIDA